MTSVWIPFSIWTARCWLWIRQESIGSNFVVKRTEPSPERPHGLNYSLTLHGEDGERLVGFDNAHRVRQSQGPGGRAGEPYDHKHRLRTIRPYQYQDAATLLADFWAEVDAVLKEKGVIP